MQLGGVKEWQQWRSRPLNRNRSKNPWISRVHATVMVSGANHLTIEAMSFWRQKVRDALWDPLLRSG